VRIGVFGGTFDPIHYGHLRLAEEARESFGLELVIFLPACVPPHKRKKRVAPAAHRLEMVKRAVAGNPAFQVSDLECSRPGPSYSLESLCLLRERQAPEAELFFLVGLDAFLFIHTWKAYRELFAISNWIVLGRAGFRPSGKRALPAKMSNVFHYDPNERAWVHPSGHRVFFRGFRSLEISGTEIRNLLENGRSVKYLLPEEVADYINLHGLYGAKGESRPVERAHGS
jgi:nicotinate-nucleotide adenylyltransferase